MDLVRAESLRSESIPMYDLSADRSDALRKIHAQSSAETSGLGDSLQRIHTLSSTETSGYGDTVPSPTGPPTPSPDTHVQDAYPGYAPDVHRSPEIGGNPARRTMVQHQAPQQHQQAPQQHHQHHQAPQHQQAPQHYQHHQAPQHQQAPQHYQQQAPQDGRRTAAAAAAAVGGNPGPEARAQRPSRAHRTKMPPSGDGTPEFVSLAKGKTKVQSTRRYARHASPPPPDLSLILSTRRPAGGAPAANRPRLQRSKDLDDGDIELGVYSPTETPPPAAAPAAGVAAGPAAPASPAPRPSGASEVTPVKQSTWLKWSEDRRTSFKKRLDTLEQRHKDLERTRVSTPVRKARKESVMFVSGQFDGVTPTTATTTGTPGYPPTVVPSLAARGSTDKPPPSGPAAAAAAGSGADAAAGRQVAPVGNHVLATAPRKPRRQEQDAKVDVKLSEYQMNALAAFWEHDVFVRSRWTGIILSIVSFVFGLTAATNYNWSTFTYPDGYVEVYGLWQNCSSNYSSGDTGDLLCSILDWTDWQNAVIGLLIFSVAFGFLATVLSICGVCTTQLAKKIYYYHSAGEIYLICALATAAGLVVYPVAIEVNQSLGVHSFGVGYGLGWVASMFFLASALCMCLDDLVRAFARGMCKCCRRDSSSDTRV